MKMRLEDIEKANEKKQKLFDAQGGKCYFCDMKFTNIAQVQMAHRIGQGYRELYGTHIVDHYLNFRITCDKCNVKAAEFPDTQTGKDILKEISEDLIFSHR